MSNGAPLAGRVALITGASSGVGRHLAQLLAAHGAQLVCCARRKEQLGTLVAAIEAAGGEAIAQRCDVRDASSIAAAFDAGEARFGPIGSVIVNAGINIAGPALELADADLDAILSVNLRGSFLTAREAARRMIADTRSGQPRRIVLIASILGLRPQAGAAAYAMSKAGMVMMAKACALEWARHGINVNAICPGFMPTDIVEDWFQTEGGRRQIESWPRRRLMPLGELDGPVLQLLSVGAAAITGAALVVDDGQSLAF